MVTPLLPHGGAGPAITKVIGATQTTRSNGHLVPSLVPLFINLFLKIFFWCGLFKSLYWICYSIASVLCFGFFGCMACGILVPQPGIKLASPALEGRVSTTGMMGKSFLFEYCFLTNSINALFLQWAHTLCVSPSAFQGFPDGATDRIHVQCRRHRRHGFDPGVKKIWSRKWQSTQVFLSGKSHGQKNLVGYSPWGCKESDPTEQLSTHTPKGQRRVISGKGRTFLAINDLVLLQKQVFLVSHYLSETCNDFTRNIMTRKNYL